MTIGQLIGLIIFGYPAINGLFKFIFAVRFEKEPFDRSHLRLFFFGVIFLNSKDCLQRGFCIRLLGLAENRPI